MNKLMVVLTKQDNKPVAIAKSTIAVVEPMKNGCKVITTLVTSPYEGHVKNIEYYVQEPATFIIGAMNS